MADPTEPSVESRTERLLPLLAWIQANLNGDLSLRGLAERVDLSPTHFQRVFKARFGESSKHYCQRLRLEQAAFRLLVYNESVLDTALACGFDQHDTFTRAFAR